MEINCISENQLGGGRRLQQHASIENLLNSSPDGSYSSSTSSLVVACSSSTSAPVVAVASSSSVVARDASGNAPTTALTMAGISSVVSGCVFCHLFCRSLLVWLAFLLGGGAVEAVVVLWGCSLGVAGDFLPDVALEVAFFLCCVVLVFDWAAFRDVFRVDLGIFKPLLHFQRAT